MKGLNVGIRMANKIESWLKATNTKEEGLGEPKREGRRSLHYEQSRPHCCFVPSWGVHPQPAPSLHAKRSDDADLQFPFAKQPRTAITIDKYAAIGDRSDQLCFDFFTPMTGLGSKRFQQFQTFIRCNLGSLAERLSAQSHQLQSIALWQHF